MPPVLDSSSTYMVFYQIADFLIIAFTKFCLVFFTVGIAFGIFRMLFLIFLCYKNKRKEKRWQGYRITFEPKAYAYTEAPESLKNFIKQRFRWSYGILQCLWKHRGALFNPKQKSLGFMGLPNMISQYIFQTFAPLADLVFIVGLFGDTPKIVTYYVAFLVLDLFVPIYAFKLEKVNTKLLLLLVIQRFIYRQFLTFTIWRSLTFAARGVLVSWNKLKRSGNVQIPAKNLEEGA